MRSGAGPILVLAVVIAGCESSPTETTEPPPPPPPPPAEFTRYATVSAGGDHTCAIDTNGRTYCWGLGTEGRLGNGSTDSLALRPAAIASANRFFDIAAGDGHVCATAAGGALYCWGFANLGQVGNRSSTAEARPFHVREPPFTFIAVSTGYRHSCGIGEDLRAYCWGWNFHGQLGNGSEIGLGAPSPVVSQAAFAMISAGNAHTCGLTTTGVAFCWGDGASGQLGDGSRAARAVPTPVGGSLAFSIITAGGRHTCGLTLDGQAYCWGAGTAGQLGTGELADATSPRAVTTTLRFTTISAGEEHTCAIDVEGAAHCWGHNNYGRLGRASLPGPQPTPARTAGDVRFSTVSAGRLHTCAIATDGALYCWGFGGFGQLGTGFVIGQNAPARVSEPES